MFKSINSKTYKPVVELFPTKRQLPMHLQFFADPTDPPTDPPADPPASPPTDPPATPDLTLEAVQSFVEENKDGKAWLQSLADGRVTEAIKTYETKTLPKKVEDEINKRYPAETEDQKKMRALQQQFDDLQKEKETETLRNFALSQASNDELPASLVNFFLGTDESATKENLGTLKTEFEKAVNAKVEAKFKEGGRTPKDPPPAGQTLTKEQIEKMSTEEIDKNWKQVEEYLSNNK